MVGILYFWSLHYIILLFVTLMGIFWSIRSNWFRILLSMKIRFIHYLWTAQCCLFRSFIFWSLWSIWMDWFIIVLFGFLDILSWCAYPNRIFFFSIFPFRALLFASICVILTILRNNFFEHRRRFHQHFYVNLNKLNTITRYRKSLNYSTVLVYSNHLIISYKSR